MLGQRSLSAVVIVASAVIPAVLGHPILTIVLVALASVSIYEFSRAVSSSFASVNALPPAALGSLIVIAVAFDAHRFVISALVTIGILALLAINLLRADLHGATRDWALATVGVLYVAVPIAHIPAIRDMGSEAPAAWVQRLNDLALSDHPASGLGWLVFIVAVTWLTDTAAYVGGRAFGRRKLSPILSPGKTVEGALIGTLVGALTGGAAIPILGLALPVYVGLVIGGILSIVGQIGDLAESLIKRDLGVKDMGNVIPGHGGMLDRIDALLFSLPAGFYLLTLALEVGW